MTPQQVAEPADEPQAALIATCTCGRPIRRLALDSARGRHDNWAITCPPPDPAFDHLVKGNQRVSDDRIRIEIDHRQWHAWRVAAVRARITQEGMSGLLELRISVKARARGATLTEQPRLWLRHDPIALVVHARGEGLTPELVREAVAELTAEAEIAAEAEAAFMASMDPAP